MGSGAGGSGSGADSGSGSGGGVSGWTDSVGVEALLLANCSTRAAARAGSFLFLSIGSAIRAGLRRGKEVVS